MADMSGFIYHEEYLKYQFGFSHPFNPIREKYTLDTLKEIEVIGEKSRVYSPEPATETDLYTVHSNEYVQFIREMCEKGFGYLDSGDTPATKGLYEGACRVVGGSILGAKLIMDGDVDHTFNPGGGLHHAKADKAAGFCVFNDIAIATRYLQRTYGLKRIAILDVDGHHGDGTQQILYREPILKISTHRIGIFPGTGYVSELGTGKGTGYSINIPLQARTGDEAYLYAFKELVPPLLESYKPEIIINQFGVDGHYEDPLVGLGLTTRTYEEVAKTMHSLAHELCEGRLLVLGGGGYDLANTTRCWAIMFATICGGVPENHLKRYRQLFDQFPPPEKDWVLEMTKSVVEEVKKAISPFHTIRW